MAGLPRILTVDPTGMAARIVRAGLTMLERPVIQVDVPGDVEALDEVQHGRFRAVIAAATLSDAVSGAQLARHIKSMQPETSVILLHDSHESVYEPDTRDQADFIVLRRPVDGTQIIRVLMAALDGRDILSAAFPVASVGATVAGGEVGYIPSMNQREAAAVIDTLATNVGAMAVVLSSRAGEVLVEHGAVGYLDRESLTAALLPTVTATTDMGRIVGGHSNALMVYEGDTLTVFVLSVGMHHFVSVIFSASGGTRALGAVRQYGRRAVDDLVALVGASSVQADAPPPVRETKRKKRSTMTTAAVVPPVQTAPPEPELFVAPEFADLMPMGTYVQQTVEAEALVLEPLAELDVNIFGQEITDLQAADLDDMFNPEKLAAIANESKRGRGPLSYEEAKELGLVN